MFLPVNNYSIAIICFCDKIFTNPAVCIWLSYSFRLITHDIVAITHPGYSPGLWDRLERMMPWFREDRTWLKRSGVKMGM